jgi:hypothetical protein
MTAKRSYNPTLEAKLRFIGQAHVLPGMSLSQLHAIILARYGVPIRNKADSWANIPNATLDLIAADIQAVTQAHPVPAAEVQP